MDRVGIGSKAFCLFIQVWLTGSLTFLTARDIAAQPTGPQLPSTSAPRAVTVARATELPACTVFVDASVRGGTGTVSQPYNTIAAAVAAAQPGATICVTEGIYAEQIKPGEKHFTFAGGFQRGQGFKVRDSAKFVSKAAGRGGSFILLQDPAPHGEQRTVVDGFDIAGYARAIVREFYISGRFDITNNHIHDNVCTDPAEVGAGFALSNVSGRIHGNVIANNRCGRGGGGFINDATLKNSVVIDNNRIEGNAGTEPDSAHGGGLYLFVTTLRIEGNLFLDNTVTQWGGGLYVGADSGGGQKTTAQMNWNVYRGNTAGNSGGGFFCDDGATCISTHEIYDRNCGGNILLDSGSTDPTSARFDHITNVYARAVGCQEPGNGIAVTKGNTVAETYTVQNSIFWGNAKGGDISVYCDQGCTALKVTVLHSVVQKECAGCNFKVTFGEGIGVPWDPHFADAANGDFHLKSAFGRWTPRGYEKDAVTSPALAGGAANAGRTAPRTELGAFGNSGEASLAR